MDNSSVSEIETQWSTIFLLNGIVYTFMALTLTSQLWMLWDPIHAMLTMIPCCCVQIANIVSIALTGAFRYSEQGELCALN